MSSHDINESDDNLKINDDEESDYEQIASETNHVPEDRIDIISEDNKAAGKVKKKTKVDNTDIEIVNLEHEEIVQDELADEYDSEENQEQEISIITLKIMLVGKNRNTCCTALFIGFCYLGGVKIMPYQPLTRRSFFSLAYQCVFT